MADLFENPLGLDGFEFIEFCAPTSGVLETAFAAMGFVRVARHRSKDVTLWRQGEINLIANYEPQSPAAWFAAEHGPSACGMGWRVRDAGKAYAQALARGAEPVEIRTGPMELSKGTADKIVQKSLVQNLLRQHFSASSEGVLETVVDAYLLCTWTASLCVKWVWCGVFN